MGLLNREKLLKRADFKIEKVEFDNGDFVYVKQMSAGERDRFERMIREEIENTKGEISFKRRMDHFRAKIAEVTICDEKGNLLLKPGDYQTLSNNMTAFDMETIIVVAQRLNQVTEKDKENLTKNSVAGQAGNSNSDSVVN